MQQNCSYHLLELPSSKPGYTGFRTGNHAFTLFRPRLFADLGLGKSIALLQDGANLSRIQRQEKSYRMESGFLMHFNWLRKKLRNATIYERCAQHGCQEKTRWMTFPIGQKDIGHPRTTAATNMNVCPSTPAAPFAANFWQLDKLRQKA